MPKYSIIDPELIKKHCGHFYFILLYTQITKQQSAWRELPDVPYHCSSVCVVDGVLLAIGGNQREEGSKKTSAIYALHPVDKKWQHVGDMPFECSSVDTLLLSEGRLLVVDGGSKRVWRVTVEGKLREVFWFVYHHMNL